MINKVLGDSNSIFIKLDGFENLAQPGLRVADVLEQLKDAEKGETLIVGVGVNDSATITDVNSRGQIEPDIKSFEANYGEILRLARNKFSKVICLGLVSSTEEEIKLGDAVIQYSNSEIVRFNKTIKKLCSKLGVEFIDLLPYFLGHEDELLEDHIHPNMEGQLIIIKVIEGQL